MSSTWDREQGPRPLLLEAQLAPAVIPPAPTRILEVLAATWAIRTAVDDEATPVMLWCSAIQYRR